MAALGVVGRRACARSTAKQMEIPLAGAVCLPRRDRRISLHGFDVACPDYLAGNQIVDRNSKYLFDRADALWCRARLRVICSRVARDSRSGPGFRARIAAGESALAMACPTRCFARPYLAMLDR